MTAEILTLTIGVIACYAMRLRAEHVRERASEMLAKAWQQANDARAECASIKGEVERLRREVTALQGARNAEVFTAARRAM